MKRVLRQALVVSPVVSLALLPTVLALAVVRPASAVGPVYAQTSLTAVASGVRTDGVVGVTGGLATLDSGSAFVTETLDSGPSATVLAAPQEPGTLARTGVGQVNGAAGSNVLSVPDAEARYPGAELTGSYRTTAPATAGSISVGAAAATAAVSATRASGTAQAAAFAVAPVLSTGPSTSSASLSQDLPAGTARATGRTAVSDISVGGVLEIKGVVATAATSADHDTHTASQSLTISGATVGGTPVEIGNDGVLALGTPVIAGGTLGGATASVNSELAAAGITVHTIGGTATHTSRSADADSGGLAIDVVTPDLPAGIAGNTLSVVIGGVVLTELDQPAFAAPVVSAPPVPPASDGQGSAPGTVTRTTVIPGTPGIPATAGNPAVSAPVVNPGLRQVAYTVHGRRVSKGAGLLAFAGLQLLTLGTATLYALVERRRRLGLLGRPA